MTTTDYASKVRSILPQAQEVSLAFRNGLNFVSICSNNETAKRERTCRIDEAGGRYCISNGAWDNPFTAWEMTAIALGCIEDISS
jgi:hypothetical protein